MGREVTPEKERQGTKHVDRGIALDLLSLEGVNQIPYTTI